MEWLENNRTRYYPHVQTAPPMDAVLLDAVITLPASVAALASDNTKQGISIDHIDLAAEEISIVDNGTAPATGLFDSRLVAHTFVEDASGDYYIAHWYTDDGYSVKLVFDEWSVTVAAMPASYSSTTPLCASTVIIQPAKIAGLQAAGELLDPTEPIILDEGYNCSLTVQPSAVVGNENRNAILFAFQPGAGAGKYKDCADPEILLRRINGLGPDDVHNFDIAGDDCLFLRPIATGVELLTYCTPCCSCEDMVLTYEAIKKLLDNQQSTILPHLYNARGSLSSGISNFNAIKVAQTSNSSGFVRVFCRGGYIFQVQVVLMNPTSALIESDLTFTPSIDDDSIEGFLIDDSGYIFGAGATKIWTAQDPIGTWATDYTTTISIPARTWRGYQFELSADKDEDRKDALEFGCTVTATNITGSPWAEVTCNVVGVTGG